jgi:hypothetical protein
LVILDELYKPDKKVWAKMKALITETHHTVNPKFLSPISGASYANVVGMSNNLGDVLVDDVDRR